MKVVRLVAQPVQAPRCASFSDEEAVRRYETEMRVHRAHAEAYEVAQLDEEVDGAYRVQGSGGVYLVDVVDGSGEADTCTCVDFLTNDLGTCKHLEAVRRAIKGHRALRAAYEGLGGKARRPTVTVQVRGGLRLVKRGRWGKAQLHRAGWKLGTDGHLTPLVPAALTAPPAGVRVVHAAPLAQARLGARAQLKSRRERVKQAIDEGRLHLDRLSVPLLPLQREGAAYLVAQGRAMLADDMGLGKTIQTIAACEALCAHGEADRVLVVAPASVVEPWAREIERLVGAAPARLSGDGPALRAALESGARYKIASYETVVRQAELFAALQPDVLVLDEAQRAKNFRARTAAALRGIHARFLFALTALPVDRHLDDLYALAQLVDDEVLSPLWRFNLAFYEQDARGNITGYKNLSKLRLLLAPMLVRRRKEEVLSQLLPITRQSRLTPLLPEQRSHAQQAVAELSALLEQRLPDPVELTHLVGEARRACVDPSLLAPDDDTLASPKLDELEQLVEEISQQGPHRVLVFCEHAEPLRRAAARLERLGVAAVVLDRAQDEARRHLLVRRLASGGEALVVLLTDVAVSRLELPQVTYHIHLDTPAGPAQLERRSAAGFRPGQGRGVTEIFLVAEAGLERAFESSLLVRKPRVPCPLERALVKQRFDDEALAMLRRLVNEVRVGGPLPDAPPETPPVAHLSLSPAPPPAAPRPREAPLVIEVSASQPPPSPPPPEPDEPSPDTQRARFQPGPPEPSIARARERLRLASVVLAGGFPCDAALAAHQGLALALWVLLRQETGEPAAAARPLDHNALVAALFRALGAGGRLPPAVHAILARLHDLASLDEQGVLLDPSVARDAVDEASRWLARIEEMLHP